MCKLCATSLSGVSASPDELLHMATHVASWTSWWLTAATSVCVCVCVQPCWGPLNGVLIATTFALSWDYLRNSATSEVDEAGEYSYLSTLYTSIDYIRVYN